MPHGLKNLSTTLVQNWPLCPSRAWTSYEKRLEFGDDNEGTDATRFGTVVHDTCESIHQGIAQDIYDQDSVTDDQIIDTFQAFWADSSNYDFERFQFGRDKIVDFLRRSMFSRLGKTIATELLFVYEVETGKVWLPQDSDETAQIINQIIADGNTPVASKIDRVDRVNEKHYVITDYKTNILPFTRDEIENSRQLGVYDLVARALWPEAEKIECVYDMVRHGRFPVEFPDSFRDTLRAYLITLWKQILKTENPEERVNKYCRWCEIRSECAAYKKLLESPLPPVLTETIDTPEGVAAIFAEAERLADLVKMADERRKELNQMIQAKIVKDYMGEPMPVGDREYYLIQNPRYEFDKRKLFDLLKAEGSLMLLPDMMSVSKTSAERALKSRKELFAKVEPLLKKGYNNPTLKSRSLKGGTTSNTDETNENG